MAIQDEKKRAIAKEEAEYNAIQNSAIEASKLGASAEVTSAMANAKTAQEATAIAQKAGVYTKGVKEAEEKKLVLEGFTKILNPDQLKGLTEDEIIRFPDGRIFKKPVTEEKKKADNQATIDAYVKQIQSGRIKLTNVPASIRNDVAVFLGDSPATYSTGSGGTKKTSSSSSKTNTGTIKIGADSTGYQEGDMVKNGSKYFIAGVDGKFREAEKDEVKALTETPKYGWNEANQFISDNPDASDEELKNYLMGMQANGELELNSTQINSLVKNRK